jgi:hypothetical protein
MPDLEKMEKGGQGRAAFEKPQRSKAERKAHVLRTLAADDKLWLATVGDHAPHVVPISFVWRDERIVMAVANDSPSAWNLRQLSTARAVLGTPHDVILIDGKVEQKDPRHVEPETLRALRDASAIDALGTPGFVCLLLEPFRVQAYWTGSEIAVPTIMRGGSWLA